MSELNDLIALLYPKAMEGKLQWTFDSDDRIYTIQGRNQIEIEHKMADHFLVRIRNKDGISIVESNYFSGETFDMLLDIFYKARRSELKVDETLLDLTNRIRAL